MLIRPQSWHEGGVAQGQAGRGCRALLQKNLQRKDGAVQDGDCHFVHRNEHRAGESEAEDLAGYEGAAGQVEADNREHGRQAEGTRQRRPR